MGAQLTTFPSSAYITPEPFGVVLIISAWNYPFCMFLIYTCTSFMVENSSDVNLLINKRSFHMEIFIVPLSRACVRACTYVLCFYTYMSMHSVCVHVHSIAYDIFVHNMTSAVKCNDNRTRRSSHMDSDD